MGSTPAGLNGISVGGCPANLKIARQLKKKADDSSDDSDTSSSDSDDSSDSSADWKEFDREMQQMQNQINACASWKKFPSNNINKNGLYCQQNGQNYKCSSTPAGLNGISVGGCPANLKIARELNDASNQPVMV